jgi:hypothetical protein
MKRLIKTSSPKLLTLEMGAGSRRDGAAAAFGGEIDEPGETAGIGHRVGIGG